MPSLALLMVSLALITSCKSDKVTEAPSGDLLPVCHVNATGSYISPVFASELTEHKQKGDYVTSLEVDKATTVSGDSIHFSRITDALAVIRAGRIARGELSVAACRITINVASGSFVGTAKETTDATLERFPMIIDVPDITIQGAFRMELDVTGKATGEGITSQKTILSASPALQPGVQAGTGETMLIINGHPNGSAGNGALISGFVFQSGNAAAGATPGGLVFLSMRVKGLSIRGNRIEGGFTEPIDLRATSARIERNYLTGRGGSCGLCLAGPGDFQVNGNRQVGPGGIPGILITPTILVPVPTVVEQYVAPITAIVTASVINNEIRNQQAVPVGVGIRVGAIGIGAPDVNGIARVEATDNVLTNNRFAFIIEAAFPVANTALKSDIEFSMANNVMSGSCQTNMLVSLARHTTALGLNTLPYLKNSTYTLKLGGNIAWQDIWYGHPAGLGNSLIVDGEVIPNGSRVAYNAAKVCPTI